MQSKVKERLRRDLHLLALGHRLNRRSTPSADTRSYRRAFSASGQAAD